MRLIALAMMLGACHEPLAYTIVTGPRDWTQDPALVSLPRTTIFAVSDVHGGYDRLAALLARHGVIEAVPASPELARWAAGDSVLVLAGDLFDKGPDGLAVIELVRTLQDGAVAANGRVVVTLGNHEAEFFADPTNSKATASDGIDAELDEAHIDLVAFASGADPRGAWLRRQPFGARIGTWFFAHAGNSKGRTFDLLDAALRTAFDANDFRDGELVGDDSLLEARDWYANDVGTTADALGVRHIVFGHDPGALGARGAIATGSAGTLFRIDCGMSPGVDDSLGALLRVRQDGNDEVAEQLDAAGAVVELWRGPL